MKKTCPGFTLIELLVVFSVIAILFTIGFASYQSFNRKQIVVQAAKELKENLRLAQNKASVGEKPTGCTGTLNGWQVAFSGDSSYQIQAVCPPNTVNFKTITLPSGVTKTAGLDIVLFKALNRGVETSGSIALSGFENIATITVGSAGDIKLE